MTERYDNIVVGAGQAGPTLAGRLADAGESVAVIERRKVGGTCVNYGCRPTKTLVASARVAHVVRRSEHFGISADSPTTDMLAVHRRMERVVAQSRDSLVEWLESMERTDFIRGHARFTGERRLDVEGQTLSADRVFLNAGARARVPDIEGLERVDYLTNRTLLELTEVPDHLVVIGAGSVGLEFAQMFRRFGSRVTILEQQSRLFAVDDPDISEALREILESEGIEIHIDAPCMAVESRGDDIAIYAGRSGELELIGSHLLVATGRLPNTDDLGLKTTDIETDDHGFIRVDNRLRTSADGVWAMGDCNGEGAFTHTSYDDHAIVAANLIDDEDRSIAGRIPCYALYTDPPLGRAGMTEHQARQSDRSVLVGRIPMNRIARANERGETAGFMKVLVDADTDEILGAAILGIGGDEVIHTLLAAMYTGTPYPEIARAMHIHPTVSEMLPSLFSDLVSLN